MIDGEFNVFMGGLLFLVGFSIFLSSTAKKNKKAFTLSIGFLLIFLLIIFNFSISEKIEKKYIKEISDIKSVNPSPEYKQGIFVYSTSKNTIFLIHENGGEEKRIYPYKGFMIYENNLKKPFLFKECSFTFFKGFLYDIKGVSNCNYAVTVPEGTVKRTL